jgi:ribonuclease R
MSEILKRRIIKLLKHRDYTPVKLAQLGRQLGVGSDDYPQFKEAFEKLRGAGHVVLGERNLVSLPAPGGRIIGTFRANPKGFGFVVPLEANTHGDLFVPAGNAMGAMTGDVVAAKVMKKTRRGTQLRHSGRVVEILQRGQSRFVGTLVKEKEGWLVEPEGGVFFEPVSVDDVTAKGASFKDKVVVEIISWPSEEYLARGVIIEVLGRAGRYETEIKSIIHQYHLPYEFDSRCLNEASRTAGAFDSKAPDGREDITDKVVVTIDPPDAKDFDDAISLEKNKAGNRVLGVHIADVGFLVEAGSALDIEAGQRGNSVYLPGFTIPMLPEVLSNGICSLQPDQRRFVKSVYITYDDAGKVLSRRFANSVICSTQRLTYLQADGALRGKTKGIKPEVVRLLKDMESLSRAIEERRMHHGMLHLDLPETELVMDKAGRVVDAHRADDSYPHTIIEMFMVEANEAVAAVLDRHNVKFMRRIHPEPDPFSMENLSKLLKTFGFGLGRSPDRKALQDLLAAVKGSDFSFAVNMAVLRSLEKAEYAPLHIGHYALASNCYCHFTSPIRRYADLLVHRLLHQYISKGSVVFEPEEDLTETGKHISFTEQRAEDAERELKTVLILQMLSGRIGEELDCVVTGLAGFGVFVQSKKFGIEGLVVMADLGPDLWKFHDKNQCIVGQRTGTAVRLGQPMKVRIISVNVPARQLNLAPAESLIAESVRSIKHRKKEKIRSRPCKRKGRRRR